MPQLEVAVIPGAHAGYVLAQRPQDCAETVLRLPPPPPALTDRHFGRVPRAVAGDSPHSCLHGTAPEETKGQPAAWKLRAPRPIHSG